MSKIFGKHTITGLYEDRENVNLTRAIRGSWWADDSKWPGDAAISNGLSDNFRRIVHTQVYLGPDARNFQSAGDVRIDGPITVDFPWIGDEYGIWYFDNALKQDQQAVWRIIENEGPASYTARASWSPKPSLIQSTIAGRPRCRSLRRAYGYPGRFPGPEPGRLRSGWPRWSRDDWTCPAFKRSTAPTMRTCSTSRTSRTASTAGDTSTKSLGGQVPGEVPLRPALRHGSAGPLLRGRQLPACRGIGEHPQRALASAIGRHRGERASRSRCSKAAWLCATTTSRPR